MCTSIDTLSNRAVQRTKFSIKDFASKCDQIRSKLRILSHLLQKSLMENFFLCAVLVTLKNHELMKLNRNICSIRETKEQRKHLIT